MAPRCFPADPDFGSDAERLVFDALRAQLPADAVLLVGLRFSDRREDREADLVVVEPGVGVATIEVKGGTVSLEGTRWFQTSRTGKRTRTNPVEQALKCKYLLRDYLREHPAWRHGDPRMVHLVAFPDTDVPADFQAPDCRRDMVIGLHDLDVAAGIVRDALARAECAPRPPTADEVTDLVECLAGRMLPQRDLVAGAAVRERHCDLLTQAQARILDVIRHLPRVEVRGGAGSGKTWLAVEQRGASPPRGSGWHCSATPGDSRHTSTAGSVCCPSGSAPRTSGCSTRSGSRGELRAGSTTTATTGSAGCRRRWGVSPSISVTPSVTTRSSSTRVRTSPMRGGRPWCRACGTGNVAGCSSSPTRASGCSPGTAGHRSSWCRSRSTRTCATPSRSRRRSAA